MPTLTEKLIALNELHERGLLTDDEFRRAKARVIAEEPSRPAPSAARPPATTPPPAPPQQQTLNPVVPGVGLSLGAATIAAGGMAG